MTVNLRLAFLTNTNEAATVTVHRANPAVTNQVVNTSMDNFISSGGYYTRGRGQLASKKSAHLRVIEFIDFDVA